MKRIHSNIYYIIQESKLIDNNDRKIILDLIQDQEDNNDICKKACTLSSAFFWPDDKKLMNLLIDTDEMLQKNEVSLM